MSYNFINRANCNYFLSKEQTNQLIFVKKQAIQRNFLFIIIPTQCFYRFFGDFDWSVGKIKLFLHFDKNPCVGIFDNCLDFTVLDCVDNNELYRKLYNFYQIKFS